MKRKKNKFVITRRSFKAHNIEAKTLVEKVAENIKTYIYENLTPGEKIPPSTKLAEIFNVSLKTVHDSVKLLAKEGVLYTRRGRYGTIVLNTQNTNITELYNYQKIEQQIKKLIKESCQVGDKLPSIKQLANNYKTSEKTIKKALDNLVEDGYLTFMRGRYGGTFVTDMPHDLEEAYTWIALNSSYIEN